MPPTFKSNAKPASATWGRVTQVDDPEHLGRVQVSLPALGDVETEWMGGTYCWREGVKRIVAMPDVGDQVLILFVDGETSSGVVLGGLYGMHGPDDYGVDVARTPGVCTFATGEQKIRLDDTGQSIQYSEASRAGFVDYVSDEGPTTLGRQSGNRSTRPGSCYYWQDD